MEGISLQLRIQTDLATKGKLFNISETEFSPTDHIDNV